MEEPELIVKRVSVDATAKVRCGVLFEKVRVTETIEQGAFPIRPLNDSLKLFGYFVPTAESDFVVELLCTAQCLDSSVCRRCHGVQCPKIPRVSAKRKMMLAFFQAVGSRKIHDTAPGNFEVGLLQLYRKA